MKTGHLVPRPMRTRGEKSITWARTTPPPLVSDGITYRLARRDYEGVLHYEQRVFFRGHSRSHIASLLWEARVRLREAVDARNLVILGLVEKPAPQTEARHG